jgi:hypothetical protein
MWDIKGNNYADHLLLVGDNDYEAAMDSTYNSDRGDLKCIQNVKK